MSPIPASRRLAALWAAVLPLLVAGCTGGDDAAGPSPAPSPTAATEAATPAEVERALGEPASFEISGRNDETSQVRLAVTDVTTGRIRHLSDFRLSREARRSTPYYATVRVANTGDGNLSRTRLTLWGLDSEGTVHPPADVVGSFRRCQNDPLPRGFTRGEKARTCLLFLIPEGATLDAVQYRFNDRPPFSWPAG